MADLGGEFGDSNDDRNWRNPFNHSRNVGVHETSSEEQFHSPRSTPWSDRRPHPPGVRENSAEIIRALRGLGPT
ncbi:hypothetical protein FOZ63_005653 [Perkinsus olseni]|uniref:Uncharacterized protein n=1 Tax=Perkinsus olseni TaxID=32597 RepID=A0A7J6QSM7_PEROL|nr:hypothetical protein FOZ63_005653 [Perkinsus olseni]